MQREFVAPTYIPESCNEKRIPADPAAAGRAIYRAVRIGTVVSTAADNAKVGKQCGPCGGKAGKPGVVLDAVRRRDKVRQQFVHPEEPAVTSPSAPPPHLGFLTVLRDANGYLGGYLATNLWGRPLEFRLSTAVQPNRVQQILYGGTLDAYVCGELIGKTLVDKTATPVQVVLTDCPDALHLRRVTEIPVVWVAGVENDLPDAHKVTIVRAAGPGRGRLVAHPEFAADVPPLKELFERLAGLDVAEPFARIREAVAEARKMGVTQRAA